MTKKFSAPKWVSMIGLDNEDRLVPQNTWAYHLYKDFIKMIDNDISDFTAMISNEKLCALGFNEKDENGQPIYNYHYDNIAAYEEYLSFLKELKDEFEKRKAEYTN